MYIFVVSCHLGFGNGGGLQPGNICRGSRREVEKNGSFKLHEIIPLKEGNISPILTITLFSLFIRGKYLEKCAH